MMQGCVCMLVRIYTHTVRVNVLCSVYKLCICGYRVVCKLEDDVLIGVVCIRCLWRVIYCWLSRCLRDFSKVG